MLQIKVALSPEGWDEEKEEFVEAPYKTLTLEHSLISLSKWESKWHKPFLNEKEKTYEETIDYIKCMTLTSNVDPDVYNHLSRENIEEIDNYIGDPMTATTFKDDKRGRGNKEIVTAEIIYHWMIALQIPDKFEKWHLNRLITLIRVCEIKNSPQKKMPMKERLAQQHALNAARKKQLNTRG